MPNITSNIAAPLLAWFDENKRVLPFRTNSTPYRVWVSEIMLQQTRVSAAMPFFERFMRELPTIQDLADCEPERLHKLWEGLGYYSRVRNLQKAAQIVVEQHGGALPSDYGQLLKLPGIGEYTAGAIASISFGLPEVAVDGNVLRVFARLLGDDGNVLHPDTKQRLAAKVRAAQPPQRPGAYNEALMELGALVCIPNGAPQCPQCPLVALCTAHKTDTAEALPIKTPLKARKIMPLTVAVVFCKGRVLLHRRPENGLLAGLWEPLLLPQSDASDPHFAVTALADMGLIVRFLCPLGQAKHVFTHLEWHMTGFAFIAESDMLLPNCIWAAPDEVRGVYTLPNAFKAYRTALLKPPKEE